MKNFIVACAPSADSFAVERVNKFQLLCFVFAAFFCLFEQQKVFSANRLESSCWFCRKRHLSKIHVNNSI